MGDIPRTTNNSTLYDENGNEVAIILDGTVYRIAVDANITKNTTNPKVGKFISAPVLNGGSPDMNVNGSITPMIFSLTPPINKKWVIHRLLLLIEDNAMSWNKFGGISPLTNGVKIDYDDNAIQTDISHTNIKKNRDFVIESYDTNIKSESTDLLSMRWTFKKSGTPLVMLGSTNDEFRFTINDNLTGLIYFHAIIQGYEVDE